MALVVGGVWEGEGVQVRIALLPPTFLFGCLQDSHWLSWQKLPGFEGCGHHSLTQETEQALLCPVPSSSRRCCWGTKVQFPPAPEPSNQG